MIVCASSFQAYSIFFHLYLHRLNVELSFNNIQELFDILVLILSLTIGAFLLLATPTSTNITCLFQCHGKGWDESEIWAPPPHHSSQKQYKEALKKIKMSMDRRGGGGRNRRSFLLSFFLSSLFLSFFFKKKVRATQKKCNFVFLFRVSVQDKKVFSLIYLQLTGTLM